MSQDNNKPQQEDLSAREWADVIRIIRRAPLTNMDEAEAVNGLLVKIAKHAERLHPVQQPDPLAVVKGNKKP